MMPLAAGAAGAATLLFFLFEREFDPNENVLLGDFVGSFAAFAPKENVGLDLGDSAEAGVGDVADAVDVALAPNENVLLGDLVDTLART